MHIYLVRHGEKEKTPGDPGLTERGRRQASAVAAFFKKIHISHLYSSPFLRTRQTATHISKECHISCVTDERLYERMNWNIGVTRAQFLDEWNKASRERSYQPQCGDSSFSAASRLESVIVELEKEKKDASVVFVTHGGIITDFLRNKISDDELIRQYFKTKENLDRAVIQECSITHVVKESDAFQVISIGNNEHLAGVHT